MDKRVDKRHTKSYSKDVEQKAISMFDNGILIKTIAQELGLTISTARLLIIRSGRKPIKRADRIRQVKFNPFALGTEESYYWLGYFLADGCITTIKNGITINCKTDPEHLSLYGRFIGKSFVYRHANGCPGIGFSNPDVRSWLINIGVTTNKSYDLCLKIPLNRHILRGFFDGDGCVSQGVPKITCGAKPFVDQIVSFLNYNDIYPLSYVKQRGMKHDTYDVRMRGDDRIRFYKLLYENSTICMERKRNQYRNELKKYKAIDKKLKESINY